MLWPARQDSPEDDEIVLATIVVYAGSNCKEYRERFRSREFLLLLLALLCPTCRQPTLALNGFYRNRRVKTTSPVGEVPGEYPEPVGLVDLRRLHCTNPECEQRYHTVLPSFLAPYRQYVNSVRQKVIEALDAGATVYSLAAGLRLFPYLIRRWRRDGEQLASQVAGAVLARVPEINRASLTAAPEKAVSAWGGLVSAALALITTSYRDFEAQWSKDRLLEFVYLFCSERRELRFWDRPRRPKKQSLLRITVALPSPDPG